MELKYCIASETKYPIFYINQNIGFDEDVVDDGKVLRGDGQGIDGVVFSKEVFSIDFLNPLLITFYVNTMGGDVKQSYDIFNSIANAKSKTKSVIQGFAFSCGGWIPLAADEVFAYDYSTWMCHNPFGSDENSLIGKIAYSIATIISNKSGRNGKAKKTVSDVLDLMSKKTYFTADELYNEGLINEIISTQKPEFVHEISNNGNVKNIYKKHQKILNNLITDKSKIKNKDMEKIINRLKLSPNSTEDAILGAIANLENQISVSNSEKEDLKNKINIHNESQEDLKKKMGDMQNSIFEKEKELSTKNEEYIDMKNKYDAMCIENNSIKGEILNIENKAKEDLLAMKTKDANTLVDKFVNLGKIKNEESTIGKWINKAIENYSDTELLLESLPTNVHLPKFVNSNLDIKETKVVEKGTADYFRLQNRERLKIEKDKKQKIAESVMK